MKIIKIKIKLNIKNACKNIYKNTRLLLVLYAPPAGKVSNFEAVRRQVLKKKLYRRFEKFLVYLLLLYAYTGYASRFHWPVVPPKKKKKYFFKKSHWDRITILTLS